MNEGSAKKNALVLYHREGHVGSITLNRPDKRNALNLALWDALDAAVSQAESDTEARVVLVRGAGECFCAGIDLGPDNELISAIGGEPGAAQKLTFYRLVRRVQAIHTRLERLPQPTIAVIQRHCLGAGLELALCCDIRLCSAETVFSMPEVKLAIITDVGGLQRLARVVGRAHAREISYRGHRFGTERAKAINLVNDVYPDREELETKALEMAEEIASNPPLAVQGIKEVFRFDEEAGLDRSLDYNAARSCMILPSEDLGEAITAYMQKRTGEFKGK
jgi:enoyl-CoA hydratase